MTSIRAYVDEDHIRGFVLRMIADNIVMFTVEDDRAENDKYVVTAVGITATKVKALRADFPGIDIY